MDFKRGAIEGASEGNLPAGGMSVFNAKGQSRPVGLVPLSFTGHGPTRDTF